MIHMAIKLTDDFRTYKYASVTHLEETMVHLKKSPTYSQLVVKFYSLSFGSLCFTNGMHIMRMNSFNYFPIPDRNQRSTESNWIMANDNSAYARPVTGSLFVPTEPQLRYIWKKFVCVCMCVCNPLLANIRKRFVQMQVCIRLRVTCVQKLMDLRGYLPRGV